MSSSPPRPIRPLRWLRRRVARLVRAAAMIERQPAPAAPPPVTSFVGNNRLLVGTRVGAWTMAFYVEADDRLLTPWFAVTGQYETALTRFFLRHLAPDSHCLDIGANFGFFACLMARHCPAGRVLGVEVDPRVAALARDNLLINGLYGPADIICAAASDTRDGLTLYRRHSRSGNTSIIDVGEAHTDLFGEPLAERFEAASLTVDDLAERLDGRVDFIKIDVEGAEPLVLAGAGETIRRNPQVAIVMEWSPGQIAAAGFDLDRFAADIAALGLACFVLDDDGEQWIETAALATLPYQAGIVLRRIRRQ